MSSDDYTRELMREHLAVKRAFKRRCTDCGRPTHNYRCEQCWKKKRGYGFESSGDAALVTSEARQRMRLNKAAPNAEKKEADPGGWDWFTPSAKYGVSPPAPPPGEQKRLIPAMSAKGHAGQRSPPRSTFWMPRKRAKETPVSEKETPAPQDKTYSQSEIARLAGVSPGSVSYALALIRKGRANLPECARKVKETLDRLGISAGTLTGAMAAAASVAPAAPEPAEDTAGALPEKAPADFPERSPEHEKAVEELFAGDWQPEEEPAPLRDVQACRVCGCTDDNACPGGCFWVEEDICSACVEAEKAKNEKAPSVAFRVDRPDHGRDFRLSHIPFEALVNEITRRMPRAEVVLR